MADTKITALSALTTPAAVDLYAVVDDPGGSPITKKITHADMLGYGTSFPGSPVTGLPFFRTDRGIAYFHDGTRWLSVTLYAHLINTGTIGGTTATTTFYSAHPWAGQYDIYVEKFRIVTLSTTTTASNYFTHQLATEDGASSANVGSAISGLNNTQNQFVTQETAIAAVIASTVEVVKNVATETGTSSTWITALITYRLVG